MSVGTAFSLVLVAGFGTTALVGFLAWRERIRDGVGVTSVAPDVSRDCVDP
jgi:hypothetical protein